MRNRIEKVLAEEVRPMLAMHGGNVELVEVADEGLVKDSLHRMSMTGDPWFVGTEDPFVHRPEMLCQFFITFMKT